MSKAPTFPIPDHTIHINLNDYVHVKQKMTLEDLDTFFDNLFMEKNASPSNPLLKKSSTSDDCFKDPSV